MGVADARDQSRPHPGDPGADRLHRDGTALHEGETIKAVSEYLGHADPGFTLRTYTHLMEGSSERTKRAVGSVFKPTRAIEEPSQSAAVDGTGEGSGEGEESANGIAEPE